MHATPDPALLPGDYTADEVALLRHAGCAALERLRHLVAERDSILDPAADPPTMQGQLIVVADGLDDIARTIRTTCDGVQRQVRLRRKLAEQRPTLADRDHRCAYPFCPGHADALTDCGVPGEIDVLREAHRDGGGAEWAP
jgi:hypothetical protein